MAVAPLFVKYRTTRGNCYVYFPHTNEIVRIGEAVYQIIDDYHVLDTDEISQKYRAIGGTAVSQAILQLEEMHSEGILHCHAPQLTTRAENIRCEGKVEPLREFLRSHRRLLTLELTQRCNLRCEYCCFGEHYHQTRQPCSSPMSLETAKAAITSFMNHQAMKVGIGFYGGEPLLEFHLLKQIVLFSEEMAASRGMTVRFAMTTNGTLLTDDVIHFLAHHKFSVMVSLDGDKDSHDRYRVFRDEEHPGRRIGSFDLVIQNMNRFVELYPEYPGRGILVTLTATSDLEKTERFLSRWRAHFPTIIGSFVQPISTVPRRGCVDRSIGPVDSRAGFCSEAFCGRPHTRVLCETDGHELCFGTPPNHAQPEDRPSFCNWTTENSNRFRSDHDRFMANVRGFHDIDNVNVVRDDHPLGSYLLDRSLRHIHFRQLSTSPHFGQHIFRQSCYPGATRTFCSVQGTLYSCEKTQRGPLFTLGQAVDDVDVDRACQLTEMVRLLCDCGNCVGQRFCTHCPALVSESREGSGVLDTLAFQKECGQMSQSTLLRRLVEYTEIMESNPRILDALLAATAMDEDWLDDVKIVAHRQNTACLEVEELDGASSLASNAAHELDCKRRHTRAFASATNHDQLDGRSL